MLKTETNLDVVLKSFNSKKLEEIGNKGMIKLTEKKFNFKESETNSNQLRENLKMNTINNDLNSSNFNLIQNNHNQFNRLPTQINNLKNIPTKNISNTNYQPLNNNIENFKNPSNHIINSNLNKNMNNKNIIDNLSSDEFLLNIDIDEILNNYNNECTNDLNKPYFIENKNDNHQPLKLTNKENHCNKPTNKTQTDNTTNWNNSNKNPNEARYNKNPNNNINEHDSEFELNFNLNEFDINEFVDINLKLPTDEENRDPRHSPKAMLNSNSAPEVKGQFIEKNYLNHKIACLKEWGREFEWDDLVANANLRVFGYKTFRPNQREIINASLCQKDIFVCMPTGGGKSLTFQIPAMISDGTTVIVMPLISLIQDQVSAMRGLGVNVLQLTTEVEKKIFDERNSFDELFISSDPEERVRMIFVTPEKIAQSHRTMNLLRNLNNMGLLDRFVIDEAHCVSQWGREFRPDYLNLKILRHEFPNVPLLAITATAPNKIREDIISQLRMKDALFFRSSYNRNNLYIEIRNKKEITDPIRNMADYIRKKYPDSCGLIYCGSRKDCEMLSEKLRKDYGLSVHYYHASMPEKLKYSIQEKWKNDEIKIIVATIAFGMGINKSDVRFVFHYAMPRSFENYYQEIGRAGRDGKKSNCILYYNPSDRRTLDFLLYKSQNSKKIVTQNLRKITEMIEYCEEACECRRVIALLYFDENFNRNDCNKMCDNCKKNLQKEEANVTDEAITILTFLRNCLSSKIDMTMVQMIDYLRGFKNKKKNLRLPMNDYNAAKLKDITTENMKKIIRRLSIMKYIDESLQSAGNGNNIFSVLSLSDKGLSFLNRLNSNLYANNLKINQIWITFPKSGSNKTEKKENESNIKVERNDVEFIEKTNIELDDMDSYNYVDLTVNTNVNSRRIYTRPVDKNGEKNNKNVEKNDKRCEKNDKNGEKNDKNDKKQKFLEDEDYGYCTREQFDEILEKLKMKRREILKVENRKIENENALSNHNNLNNIHSENLDENIINNINDNIYIPLIKKLSADEIFPLTGLKELCRKLPTCENELNSNYIFGVGAKFLQKYGKEFIPEILKHVSIYKIKKNENNFDEVVNKSVLSSKKKISVAMNNNFTTNKKNYTDNSFCLMGTEFKSPVNTKVNQEKQNELKNSIAMFNSMSDDKYENVNKNEILIDFSRNLVQANDHDILSSFMKDIEKLSNELKNDNDNEKEKENENDAFNINKFNPVINIRESDEILYENDFGDFETYRMCIDEDEEEEKEKIELKNFANQAKAISSNLPKKRKRGTESEDENGETRPKNSKSEFFKRKAFFNKIRKKK